MSDTLLRRCDASMWLHQFLGSFRAPTRQKQRARSAAMTYDWKKQQREKPPKEKEGGAAGGNDQKPFEQNVLKGTCALPLYVYCGSYLLGLLAMIKCSICSYQCDNWYVSNWRLACHINFLSGKCPLELAQGPSRVVPDPHFSGDSTPFGVTSVEHKSEISLWCFNGTTHALSLAQCKV